MNAINTIKTGLLVLMLGFAVGVQAQAGSWYVGEEQTTHRAGDVVPYSAGCHTLRAALDIAEAESVEEGDRIYRQLIEADACFLVVDQRSRKPVLIPVQLKQWMAGPFDTGNGRAGSVWKGLDVDGDTVFLLLYDDIGAHEPDLPA